MLRKAHGLIDAKIHGTDGDMGHVDDFYFDDLNWTVRYMIVRTGSWFTRKQVMLSPAVIREVVWDEKALYVDLTQDQIENSPDLDLAKPVTREQEMELANYYQWPAYWSAAPGAPGSVYDTSRMNTGVAGTGFVQPGIGIGQPGIATPGTRDPGMSDEIAHDISNTDISRTATTRTGGSNRESANREIANTEGTKTEAELRRAAQAEGLHHYLHGVKEVTGYNIAATDGDIGHVDDFFIDEESWRIQYLLVDTGKWLPGRKVLISPEWIQDILWEDSDVRVNATREQVKESPEYDPHAPVDRHYETRLYGHYGFPPYWA